jgi:adenylosuccinate synthase
MAIRTFPIRVAGNSGPLKDEITWEQLRERSRYPTDIREFTTTTKKLRRVGLFDFELVRRAVLVNRPTQIALHGGDYLSHLNKSVCSFIDLEGGATSFIQALERNLDTPVAYIGTGPANQELVDRVIF